MNMLMSLTTMKSNKELGRCADKYFSSINPQSILKFGCTKIRTGIYVCTSIRGHTLNLGVLRNHCNIFLADGGIHSKSGGKTASSMKQMMHKFSLHFWRGYLHQPKKYFIDSLSFNFDVFNRSN